MPLCELPNIFIYFFVYFNVEVEENLVTAFVPSIIFLLFFVPSVFNHYSASTEDSPPEDIDAQDISSLIASATQHVNQTAKAIESGNSTVALGLLAQVRTDLNNINGNVTDFIFSVSEAPP